MDDFKDKIEDDSEYEDRDMQRGIMTNDMVNALNFGGGEVYNEKDAENRKKTREERHAEIMEKSKAYRLHHQEIKEATHAYTKELDDDWKDVSGLLNFSKNAPRIPMPKDAKVDAYDDLLVQMKTEGIKRAIPMKQELSEKEKAQVRREKLEKLA
jgi:hypothetical protein